MNDIKNAILYTLSIKPCSFVELRNAIGDGPRCLAAIIRLIRMSEITVDFSTDPFNYVIMPNMVEYARGLVDKFKPLVENPKKKARGVRKLQDKK